MAKEVLPVDFKDDILSKEMAGRRKYQMITNADGTVSLIDATVYDQQGSDFGQAQVNAMCKAINESADKSDVIDSEEALLNNEHKGKIAGALVVKAMVSALKEKITSFENTKSEIVGSALGKAMSMLTSNTWAEIVGKIKQVKNLSVDTPIKLSSTNATRVVKGDGVYIGDNTDGVKRITIRYSGDIALIAGNTLLGAPASDFGTAAAANVLTGQTFTSQNGVKVSGSMPNRSTLGWAPDGPETYAVPAGYYTGGWLNAKPAYEAGIAYADSRVNKNSVSYDEGYRAGLAAGRTSAAAVEEGPSLMTASIEGDAE